jgi:hypothetical protein
MPKNALFTYAFLGKRTCDAPGMTKLTLVLKLLIAGYSGHPKSSLSGGRRGKIKRKM